MAIVEQHAHLQVGGEPAQWAIHDDGSWEATYGPHNETGQHNSPEEASAAARAWVNILHKAYTGDVLPVLEETSNE